MVPARVIVAALLLAELLALVGPYPLRVVAGLPLVLVLPGLAVAQALRRRTAFASVEAWLLVPGLSLTVALLTGLIVYALGLRLTTGAWAAALGLVTIGALALDRPQQLWPATDLGLARALERAARYVRRKPTANALVVFAGAAAVAAAFLVAIGGQRGAPTPGFTQLWATRAHAGGAPAVAIGVESHEHGVTRYLLRVYVAGQAAGSETIELRPSTTWRRTQSLATAAAPVTVTLTKVPDRTRYRYVRLAPA
jgi:uncharacterized membrane protein